MILAGCTGCELWQKRNIQKPKVNLQSVKIKNIDLKSASLTFALEVENQNPFELKVDSVRYDVELGEKQLATESILKPLSVGANSKTVIELPLTVQISDIFRSVGDFLENKAITYRIKGFAKSGIFNIPFEHQGDLSIKE